MNAQTFDQHSLIYGNTTCNPQPPSPPPLPPSVCTGPDPAPNPDCMSPLTLNISSGPYLLCGLDDPVSFDMDVDGVLDRVSWTARGAQLAFLGFDRNGNGAIDDGSELFGNHTLLPTGGVAGNGFAALAALDANGDGMIDASDPIWPNLLLWIDLNHDGASQLNELSRLNTSGITALSCVYHWTGRRDQYGNVFRFQALYYRDRVAHPYYDIYFLRAR